MKSKDRALEADFPESILPAMFGRFSGERTNMTFGYSNRDVKSDCHREK
jgi:hypothetical protein